MIVFILTMPNVGSWNGKWTGANDLYCKAGGLGGAKEKELGGKSFYYRWSDGWRANVKCEKMGAKETNKMLKASKGFCGYDWMVDSIIKHNKIIT